MPLQYWVVWGLQAWLCMTSHGQHQQASRLDSILACLSNLPCRCGSKLQLSEPQSKILNVLPELGACLQILHDLEQVCWHAGDPYGGKVGEPSVAHEATGKSTAHLRKGVEPGSFLDLLVGLCTQP